MGGKRISDIHIGDSAERQDRVLEENADRYASIVGDRNPLHFASGDARNSRFAKPIAHGMILAGYISAVIGMSLPGHGCIYEKQTLNFLAPVFYGDTILTRITVSEVDVQRNRVTLTTECFNQDGKPVLTGFAVVLPRK